MTAQIFLVAPEDADPQGFAGLLAPVLEDGAAAALLVPRGNHGEGAYKALVKAVLPVAQAAGCAVLVEGEPGLVRLLGADGLHVPADPEAVRAAVAALKPDFIVGADAGASRHEAMTLGELGPDYLFFGPRRGAADPRAAELAEWWAQTMDVPAVYSDPAATVETLDARGCEFVALGESLWAADGEAGAALSRFADQLARS